MSMPRSEFGDLYCQMTEEAQSQFLARVAAHFNLMGRMTYAKGDGVADPIRLRQINEAQNRVVSQLVHLLGRDNRRYPDKVFANILADQCDALKIQLDDLCKFVTRM